MSLKNTVRDKDEMYHKHDNSCYQDVTAVFYKGEWLPYKFFQTYKICKFGNPTNRANLMPKGYRIVVNEATGKSKIEKKPKILRLKPIPKTVIKSE